MSVIIRLGADPNLSLDCAIERLSDGFFFDFNSGTFVVMTDAVGTNFHLALPQGSSWPGRYAAAIAHQQLGEFPLGETFAFWFCSQTGLSQPSRTALVMHGGTINSLPWSIIGYEHAIAISEPAAAF